MKGVPIEVMSVPHSKLPICGSTELKLTVLGAGEYRPNFTENLTETGNKSVGRMGVCYAATDAPTQIDICCQIGCMLSDKMPYVSSSSCLLPIPL